MDKIHSKWRKPTLKISSKQRDQLTAARAAARARKPNETATSATESLPATSTTAKKLQLFVQEEKQEDKTEKTEDFYIISSDVLSKLMAKGVCESCSQPGLCVSSENIQGFARTFRVKCENCDLIHGDVLSSPRVSDPNNQRPAFVINKRMVEGFTSIGDGYAAMETLGKEVGMNVLSVSGFHKHLKKIEAEYEAMKKEMLQKTHAALRKHLGVGPDVILDMAGTCDGTWQKRGFVSLNGGTFVIDIETGLVLDFIVLSKFCHACALKASSCDKGSSEYQDWLENHQESGECQINYDGTSGGMESKAAEILWQRSLDCWNMRYVKVLSDGDTNTFDKLCKLDPYNGIPIEKEECINHMSKRLGTGLRELVKTEKAKGVTLGGRSEGALKETTITKLTSYYRSAVVKNIPDVKKTQTAILATLDHCSSTDCNPKHRKCPSGPDSWCFYNKAKALKVKPKSHDEMTLKLSPLVASKCHKVYERLSSESLISRCSRGGTQNTNESLHSQVWRKCPKEVFASRKRIEVAATQAVSEFNMGYLATLSMRRDMEELPSTSVAAAQKKDDRRRIQSERQKEVTKKRAVKRLQKAADAKKAKKTKDYMAGGH